MYTLQTLVFPHSEFGAPEEMYARIGQSPVYQVQNDRCLFFCRGGKAGFGTFYNAFSVLPWHRSCDIKELFLTLKGCGEYLVRFYHCAVGKAPRVLCESTVRLDVTEDVRVDGWPDLRDGVVYFDLTCISLDGGKIESGRWSTTSSPRRHVKLGVVITHFNRKQFVLPAIERIRKSLLDDPDYSDVISLLVVDNSRNITKEEVEGVELLPNKNYGGTGGFTRGLLHLESKPDFTHCLFMDDDASCEIESIRRAYHLFQFAKDDNLAVAGSLLRDVEPYRIFEKGARFDGVCRPLKNGLDMRKIDDLVLAELDDVKPDYGGWWFFGFNIKKVQLYPFPFFVRGDDVMFAMTNKFKIITMNGVACWGEDFGLKNGPMPTYLDARSHLVHLITHMDKAPWQSLFMLSKLFAFAVFSYNYATARAVIKALQDVQKGPSFWRRNLDAEQVRKEVSSFSPSERLVPIARSEYQVVYGRPTEGKVRKLSRFLTLNGYLIPGFFLKDVTVFQHKGFRASFREVFACKRVLYEYEPLGVGYVAEHSKRRFFLLSWAFFKAVLKFFLSYRAIKRQYAESFDEMTSRKFWELELIDD